MAEPPCSVSLIIRDDIQSLHQRSLLDNVHFSSVNMTLLFLALCTATTQVILEFEGSMLRMSGGNQLFLDERQAFSPPFATMFSTKKRGGWNFFVSWKCTETNDQLL